MPKVESVGVGDEDEVEKPNLYAGNKYGLWWCQRPN